MTSRYKVGVRSRVLRAVLTRDLLEINRPGEAQGHVLPSSEEGNPGLHEGKKWEQTESLIALLIGYKRKPQGGTLAATISEQRRSPHADRHVLRTGHRLSDFHLHLAAQEAMCSLAAVPQKGLAHHCAVSPAHHWAAWEETGAPKLGGGVVGREWRRWGTQRQSRKSQRIFGNHLFMSSSHSYNGASLDPTPLGDGDTCPHLLSSSSKNIPVLRFSTVSIESQNNGEQIGQD